MKVRITNLGVDQVMGIHPYDPTLKHADCYQWFEVPDVIVEVFLRVQNEWTAVQLLLAAYLESR